jgi:DNA-binding transcriptional LysR family regulator
MMEWGDVKVLLALLRAKSLHEAGTRLGVDRSTISRRVAALERSLGAQLFVRTREGIRPTAAAARLLPIAEKMEQGAAELAEAARGADELARGVVKIATTEALAAFLVAEGLLALREQHPDLVIELLGGNRPVDIARGEADIALRVVPPREAHLRVRCVARIGFGAFAAASYVRARGVPRTAAALRGHDVLLPGGELSRAPEARWLAARPGVRVVFRTSSMSALVAAASAGLGVAPLATAWGDRVTGLERLMTLDDVPKRAVWLVTRPEGGGALRVVGDRIAAILGRAMSPIR